MKKFLTILVTVLLLLGSVACNPKTVTTTSTPTIAPTDSQEVTKESTQDEIEIVNGVYVTGDRIAVEPIELSVYASMRADPNEMIYYKNLADLTGVTLKFMDTSSSTDLLAVLFSSGDLPDITIGGSDAQILDAGLGDQISKLSDELLQKYAPNWYSFFQQYPYYFLQSKVGGDLWSLPCIRDELSNSGIRDGTFINQVWLDQLGLKTPATLEELKDVLVAFKDHRGEGSIPEDAIPIYLYQFSQLYSCLDFFAMYGVECSLGNSGAVMIDDNGKVYCWMMNRDIVAPFEYLHSLVELGVYSSECWTDDTTVRNQKISGGNVGVLSFYYNPDPETYSYLDAMDSGNGKYPLYRQQANQVARNKWAISTECEYIEAALRVADTIADDYWSVSSMYGTFGDFLNYADDGVTIIQNPEFVGDDMSSITPMNSQPMLLDADLMSHFIYAGTQAARLEAIQTIYSDNVIPSDHFYPNVSFTAEQTETKERLWNDIKNYINTTASNWILNGGASKEFDTFVTTMKSLGIDEYVQICQDGFDAMNK